MLKVQCIEQKVKSRNLNKYTAISEQGYHVRREKRQQGLNVTLNIWIENMLTK